MTLSAKEKQVLDQLKEHLAVIAAGHPAVEIGETYEEAELCFQAMACCKLLRAADKAGFQKYLFWTGLTRRYFLERSKDEGGQNDFRRARSRSEGFFCAAAAGDIPLALEISALSPTRWMKKGEYEEDFAYHEFLSVTLGGAEEAEREASLKRFDKALKGDASARYDVCQALQEGDGAAFEQAFQELCERNASEQLKERPEFADTATFEPRSRVFTEGFALVRIAESRGIRVPKQPFPLCPETGRVGLLRRRPDDLFAEMAGLQ
ncbi:Imm49 family immunity protein [Pyxidicoccus xibeiensis]|uniref:Imm49 family immunity protein n=1 Tax=Pyxidicoccus xibeiensis TaxID=2906759 RepID=UPI0020A81ED5|nr:Imm49 family immunity protein [Pyxidicoccus xibeiensis]MCP3143934.1 immunity 49 family protein [Pyxidicoccus xibeiensis]